jgi:hypothetical protein
MQRSNDEEEEKENIYLFCSLWETCKIELNKQAIKSVEKRVIKVVHSEDKDTIL